MCLVAPVLTGHPWVRDQGPLNNTNIILKVGCSIQGSYRFLDPKFKTFSRSFSLTINFFQTFVKEVINIDLEKHRKKAFCMLHCKYTGNTE